MAGEHQFRSSRSHNYTVSTKQQAVIVPSFCLWCRARAGKTEIFYQYYEKKPAELAQNPWWTATQLKPDLGPELSRPQTLDIILHRDFMGILIWHKCVSSAGWNIDHTSIRDRFRSCEWVSHRKLAISKQVTDEVRCSACLSRGDHIVEEGYGNEQQPHIHKHHSQNITCQSSLRILPWICYD